MMLLLAGSGAAIFISVFIQVVNTICRKWFGFAILWCDEITQYVAIEACFLATPYLLMHNKELSVGLLSSIIKNERILKAIRLVFLLVEAFLFVLFAHYSLVVATSLKKSGMLLNTVHFPKYILYYIASASFALDIVSLISAPIFNKGGFYRD